MTLNVADAVRTGLDRLGTRNAAIIASVYFILNILNTAVSDTLISKFMTQIPESATTAASLALPIPGYVAGFLIIPLIAASAVLGIASLRLFSSDERKVIPKEFYAENIGKPVINLIVGGIVFGLLMAGIFIVPLLPGGIIAMIGLRIPGLIIAALGLIISIVAFLAVMVKLYFWTAAVAIDNQSFIEGFKSSWELTKGNILNVGLLLLAVITISFVLGMVFSLPQLAGLNVIGAITSGIGSALASTVTTAIIATAYNQLKVDESEAEESEKDEEKSEDDKMEDTDESEESGEL